MRRRAIGSAVVATLVIVGAMVAVGCGDDGDDDNGPPAATEPAGSETAGTTAAADASPAAETRVACDIVTQEDAEELFDGPVTAEESPSVESCIFDAANAPMRLLVYDFDIEEGGRGARDWTEFWAGGEPVEEIDGFGEEAYTGATGMGFRIGDRMITIYAGNSQETVDRERIEDLARKIEQRVAP